MKFLSNVLKTLSTLDLHAKRKGRFGTVFHNILFIGQFVNFFIAAQGKSKLKQPASKCIPTFSARSLSVHFSSKFKWGSIFCDSQR